MTASDPNTAALTIRMFGPCQVCLHGTPLPQIRARKAQWLLALLTLRAGRAVERSWLAGTLWPDSPPAQAPATLRRSLTEVRRALGPEAWRVGSPSAHQTLCLDLAGAFADVVAFDAAIARNDSISLEQAISIYQAPLLEGCDEEWVLPERAARETKYLAALETLASRAMAAHDPPAAERYLRRAVTIDPLQESAQRALMEAVAAGGNAAAAGEIYRELRLLLYRELNAEPDRETRALYQRLRAEARQGATSATGRPEGTAAPFSPRPVAEVAPSALPEGTLTFLFTDIEGSTRLWQEQPREMPGTLTRHDALLRHVISTHGGVVFKTMGDQFCAVFAVAPEALVTAVAIQRALAAEPWAATGAPRVRVALHTGTAERRDDDYFGLSLNRVARLLEVGHGGQILLTRVTQELICDHLPEGIALRDLGQHRLADLIRPEHLFQAVSPDLPADFPPLRTLDARPHNLPVQPTPFLGREREMTLLTQYLRREEGRLVTLTGPGGTGKTRLGLQVAAALLGEFSDGVFFVDLAPIRDPGLVPSTVAQVLGVLETPGRPLQESIKQHLREKQMLLVLDNFEQVLDAAPLLAELLSAAPRLKLLVTSRAVLHLRGEQDVPVTPLPVPDLKRLPPAESLSQYAAVALFIQRALNARPEFAVTNENAPAVAEICHRVDGLPLAIELAAARIKAFSAHGLLTRLQNRLQALTGGARDLPARQQTLRNTIQWSYDLLRGEEQCLFWRLSVFVGGFTPDAASAVCGGPENVVVDALTSLVDKSLLGQTWDADGEPRFSMLETIREFGQECLAASGESETIRRLHANSYLETAEATEPHLTGPHPLAWLDLLQAELDNLRAVLAWAAERPTSVPPGEPVQIGLRMAASLCTFWLRRGDVTEGREWLRRMLELAECEPRDGTSVVLCARAKSYNRAGYLAWRQGDGDASQNLYEQALTLARETDDQTELVQALSGLGRLAMYRGEFEAARKQIEESLSICREVGDRRMLAMLCNNLGFAAREQGDYQRARSLMEESLSIYRELGNEIGCQPSLAILGSLHMLQHDYATAETYLNQSLALARKWGGANRIAVGIVLGNQGALARRQGDLEVACERFAEALRIHEAVQNRGEVMLCLVGLGCVLVMKGEKAVLQVSEVGHWYRVGVRLFGAAETLRRESGYVVLSFHREDYQRCVGVARAALGEEGFSAAWAEGLAMTLDQACGYALQEGLAKPGGGR